MSEVTVRSPLVRIGLRSGRLEVRAAEGAALALEGGGRLEPKRPGEFEVSGLRPSARVTLTCPAGTSLIAGTESGDVEASGTLGAVHITTASGRVMLEEADRVDVRTASGAVEVGACREARIRTAKGAVTIGRAGQADISTATGSVRVGDAGRAAIRTASGSIDLSTSGDSAAESLSGSVRIAVSGGRRPAVRMRSVSGRIRNDCPPGEDLRVQAQTVSGDIEVVPA